jgi:hypothetical protein
MVTIGWSYQLIEHKIACDCFWLTKQKEEREVGATEEDYI